MSTLDTLPGSIDVGTGENRTYTIDVSNVLSSGQSLQSSPVPTARVVGAANNATVTGAISGSLSVSGNQITIRLLGSALRPKQSYTLIVGFNVTATDVLQCKTAINAVI